MQVGKNIFARKYKRDIRENISLFRSWKVYGKSLDINPRFNIKNNFLKREREGMNLFRNYI